jgi:hypothetical protein
MIGKPHIYIRTYGWNNSTNVDKINESKEVYKNILPKDMFITLDQCEFSMIEVNDVKEAMEFCEDNFPDSSTECEPEFYIHYTIFNAEGQILESN